MWSRKVRTVIQARCSMFAKGWVVRSHLDVSKHIALCATALMCVVQASLLGHGALRSRKESFPLTFW